MAVRLDSQLFMWSDEAKIPVALAGIPGLGFAAASLPPPKMKVLIKSAWGSSDPTQASFAFHHANAFVEQDHEVQICVSVA